MCPDNLKLSADDVIIATRLWLERAVIGLNLCPFAKQVHAKNQIRYAVSEALTPEALLADLGAELQTLMAADPAAIDTTLLIHPQVLGNFLDYNEFLGLAEAAIDALGLTGVIQVASFHPQYQFADLGPDDIENPIPMDPPDGDRIAVFTPITSPSMLNSGPPELPRLIAASV